MQQIVKTIKETSQIFYKVIGEYISWFLVVSEQSIHKALGQQNTKLIKNFLSKYPYQCIAGIAGSFIIVKCIYQYKYSSEKTSQTSAQIIKTGKRPSNSIPKQKSKFISSDEEIQSDQSPSYIKQNYDSTRDTKKKGNLSDEKNYTKQEDFERMLEKELQNLKPKRIVLQDSKSDVVFNQMYGMYQNSM